MVSRAAEQVKLASGVWDRSARCGETLARARAHGEVVVEIHRVNNEAQRGQKQLRPASSESSALHSAIRQISSRLTAVCVRAWTGIGISRPSMGE